MEHWDGACACPSNSSFLANDSSFYATMQQCFLWIAPQGHQLGTEFTVCLLQISCRPSGELWPGQDHFLALRLQIFFWPPTNAHSTLWKSEHGRRASVFVLDFIVDFTDLMMTSCLLPPTQRNTQNLCWCIFYYLLEIQYCSRLTEQWKVAGFPFCVQPCDKR